MAARLAVLVDGDNIGGAHADRILTHARKLGAPQVARVYANVRNGVNWSEEKGVQLIHAGEGKNAADLRLAIEAMELALLRGIETFVIASSDGDFSHLAHILRAHGRTVIGLGESKTPKAFRAACTEFIQIGNVPKPAVPKVVAPPAVTEMDINIRAMIAEHSQLGKGMKISDLSPRMHHQHKVLISTMPEKTWRGYLKKRPHLYDLGPRGPDAMVRFKPEGFAGKM